MAIYFLLDTHCVGASGMPRTTTVSYPCRPQRAGFPQKKRSDANFSLYRPRQFGYTMGEKI